jgi:hypothetical protein
MEAARIEIRRRAWNGMQRRLMTPGKRKTIRAIKERNQASNEEQQPRT